MNWDKLGSFVMLFAGLIMLVNSWINISTFEWLLPYSTNLPASPAVYTFNFYFVIGLILYSYGLFRVGRYINPTP